MKIAKVMREGMSAQGIVVGDRISILDPWKEGPAEWAPFTLPTLSMHAIDKLAPIETVPTSEVVFLPPLDIASRIFCVGINYSAHAQEAGRDMPEHPSVFMRTIDSVQGHGQTVIRPNASEQYDFEGEIAVVIGKGGRTISRDQAMSHVFGYTCFLDGSVRDYQKQSLMAGKNFWRSGAVGPWILTADEVRDSSELKLTTRLNGQQVQSASGDMMIYDIPSIISYISLWTPLKPGDVIATGTPPGVGLFRSPPLWMRPGDTIEVEIEPVGKLSNIVRGES